MTGTDVDSRHLPQAKVAWTTLSSKSEDTHKYYNTSVVNTCVAAQQSDQYIFETKSCFTIGFHQQRLS